MSDPQRLPIGDVRGKRGPLVQVSLRGDDIDIYFKRSTEGELLVKLNWGQAARLSELLAGAVEAYKLAKAKAPDNG